MTVAVVVIGMIVVVVVVATGVCVPVRMRGAVLVVRMTVRVVRVRVMVVIVPVVRVGGLSALGLGTTHRMREWAAASSAARARAPWS
jgi:hypothetical protein